MSSRPWDLNPHFWPLIVRADRIHWELQSDKLASGLQSYQSITTLCYLLCSCLLRCIVFADMSTLLRCLFFFPNTPADEMSSLLFLQAKSCCSYQAFICCSWIQNHFEITKCCIFSNTHRKQVTKSSKCLFVEDFF